MFRRKEDFNSKVEKSYDQIEKLNARQFVSNKVNK